MYIGTRDESNHGNDLPSNNGRVLITLPYLYLKDWIPTPFFRTRVYNVNLRLFIEGGFISIFINNSKYQDTHLNVSI